jgi:hypothetical protein
MKKAIKTKLECREDDFIKEYGFNDIYGRWNPLIGYYTTKRRSISDTILFEYTTFHEKEH